MPNTPAKIALAVMVAGGLATIVLVVYFLTMLEPGPSESSAVVADEWGTYHTDDGMLSIKMPAVPTRVTKPAPGWPNSEVHVLYLPQRVEQFAFGLRYSVLPEEEQRAPVEDLLRSIRQTLPLHMERAHGIPVRVAGERRFEQDGEKGIELTLECGEEVTVLRVYLIAGKMYTAAVTAPLARRNDPWVGRFFDSVAISKHQRPE
jgi:hypothetical protein